MYGIYWGGNVRHMWFIYCDDHKSFVTVLLVHISYCKSQFPKQWHDQISTVCGFYTANWVQWNEKYITKSLVWSRASPCDAMTT